MFNIDQLDPEYLTGEEVFLKITDPEIRKVAEWAAWVGLQRRNFERCMGEREPIGW